MHSCFSCMIMISYANLYLWIIYTKIISTPSPFTVTKDGNWKDPNVFLIACKSFALQQCRKILDNITQMKISYLNTTLELNCSTNPEFMKNNGISLNATPLSMAFLNRKEKRHVLEERPRPFYLQYFPMQLQSSEPSLKLVEALGH